VPRHPGLEGYFERPAGDMTRGSLLKLTSLLHDVAKPATKSTQPDGRVRFFGHSERGAEMVQRTLRRLRFSEQQVEMVRHMVEEHLRPGQWSSGGLPTSRALYRYFRDLGDVAVDTIFLNLADHMAARGPRLDPQDWRGHVAMAQYALDVYFKQSEGGAEPRLVTGRDLMEALGLEPGPAIGRLLAEVEEAWRTGEISTQEEALELARRTGAQ
jgi:poly(A) polymerase